MRDTRVRRGRVRVRGRAAHLAMLACAVLAAAGHAHAGPVFVSSEPYGATVTVGGVVQARPSPLVLDLPDGVYRVTLDRDGYESTTVVVDVEPGVPVSVHRSLAARYVLVDIPEELPPTNVSLPFGEYAVRGNGGLVRIAPVFPDERRLAVAVALVPVTLASAAALSVWTTLSPPVRPEVAIVPSLTAQVSAAGAIAYAAVLLVRRHRYLDTWTQPARPHRPVSAAAALSAAGVLLERGDIVGATAGFQTVVRDFPDARGVPEALYTLGRLAAVDDRSEDARGYFERIVNEYPVADYYDRALLQLARLAARGGDRGAGEAYLEMVTFVHPDVTPETVASIRSLIGR